MAIISVIGALGQIGSIGKTFDNVICLFVVKVNVLLCIVCNFCVYHYLCCNMNLHFWPAVLYYRINHILSNLNR